MATRYIYLQDDLNNLLKKEINVSALISDLLKRYYQVEERSKLTAQQRLDIFRKQKEQNLNPLLTEEELLLKEVEKERDRENEEEKERQRRKEKEQDKKDNIFNTFKEEVGREMTEEDYEEYQRRIAEEEPKFNLFKFCDEKRI